MLVNFYDLLSIPAMATNAEVIKAFREKAKLHHPDKNRGSRSADEMFKLITLAKETLLDPQKRLEHDYAVGVKTRPQMFSKGQLNTEEWIGWAVLIFLFGLILGRITMQRSR